VSCTARTCRWSARACAAGAGAGTGAADACFAGVVTSMLTVPPGWGAACGVAAASAAAKPCSHA
jgi:hypothetical protein